MFLRILGWAVLLWILIWTVKHPDTAATDVHNIWHVFFGSASS